MIDLAKIVEVLAPFLRGEGIHYELLPQNVPKSDKLIGILPQTNLFLHVTVLKAMLSCPQNLNKIKEVMHFDPAFAVE